MNKVPPDVPVTHRGKSGRRIAWAVLIILCLAVVAAVIVPVGLIMPFRPQSQSGLATAFILRHWSPLFTLIATTTILVLTVWLWSGSRWWRKALMVVVLIPTLAATWFARQNHFEWMFLPLPNPDYAKVSDAGFVNDSDLVMAVENQGEAVAYPIRQMAYHHVVEDTVGGVPIAVTYWTLCHTGLVWETTVDGRVLHFHLAGINNQNFIMRDEETGSWWQQVTGEAILGPLKGRRLKSVFVDQLSFSLWKKEKAHGRVLRPDERIMASEQYASADWEQRMAEMRIVAGTDKDKRLEPRTLIIGVTLANKSTAYPFTALQKQSPVVDFVGGVPILLVLGEDNRSVRAFERKVDGRSLEFFKKTEGSNWQLIDSQSGSIWDFNGKAISGTLAGKQLKKVPILEDYWFDWAIYHPETAVYQIGAQ